MRVPFWLSILTTRFWRPVPRAIRRRPCLGCEALEDRQLPSITIQFDYSLDTNHFFDDPARRAILAQAAQAMAGRLQDHLEAIVPDAAHPDTASVPDPTTGGFVTFNNLTIPADTIIVYVGSQPLSGGSIGLTISTPLSTSSTDPQWQALLQGRGQPGALGAPGQQTDYAPAFASIAFDSTTSWDPAPGTVTSLTPLLLDTAEHELGHVLGIGTAPSWFRLISGGTFTGAAAVASHGGSVPVTSDGGHWATGTNSGGPALMCPTGSLVGFPTALDFAALSDIGWQVGPGVTVSPPFGLFAADGQQVVVTTAAGGHATFSVALTSVPTSTVTITLSVSNPAEATVSTAVLVFTPADARRPQFVTVTGQDDGILGGTVPYTVLTAPAQSDDPGYNGLDAADVALFNERRVQGPGPGPGPIIGPGPGPIIDPVPTALRGIGARLTTVKAGKKKRLEVQVLFADTGAPERQFISPFQKPAFKGISVTVRDSNGDGLADQVVLTARKGRKTVTRVFAG
jgi:hypothetical protein